jgi:hypothetical protein
VANGAARVYPRWPYDKNGGRLIALALPAMVGDSNVLFDVDSGAAISILDYTAYSRLAREGGLPPLGECKDKFHAVNGTKLPVHGQVEIPLYISGVVFRHTFVVSDMPFWSGIVGLDFLDAFGAVIDVPQGQITFKCNGMTVSCSRIEDNGVRFVCTKKRTVIFPNRQLFVGLVQRRIFGYQADTHPSDTSILVEPDSRFRSQYGCLAAAVVTRSEGGVVSLVNYSSKTVVLPKGSVLGLSTPLSQVHEGELVEHGLSVPFVNSVNKVVSDNKSDNCKNESETIPAHLQELLDRAKVDLTLGEFDIAKSVITSYADVFAEPGGPLGRTTLVEHDINTGDAVPIREKLRRYAPKQLQIIDEEVDRMLAQDVIERSESPWSSPIVIVKKKDGSARMCLDVRKLNKVTKKDAYPLPRIDHALSSLRGGRFFCTMDLQSGYWQLPLAEGAKEKTAFSAPRRGQFQFKVMPFGLCNAPASFERFMERVLEGLQWESCLVYLDDIIVSGSSVENLAENLSRILGRLRSAGLKLKPSKCTMFGKQVSYLGHVVSEKGVACDPTKVESVRDWPTPQNLHDVRSFLGLAGYYREYMESFSSLAEPLFHLTRKNVPFLWSEECESAFQALKGRLTSAPILAYPDPSKPYILDTDCSLNGMGAVLSQIQDGKERVVAYASKTLSRSQRNYCTTMRELLAVVTFVKHFRHYLFGPPFVIRTDHASLVWLSNFKHPEGMLARWITSLEPYDFRIIHRKGVEHGNADGLSRRTTRPCLRGDCHDCQHFPVRKNGKRYKRLKEVPPFPIQDSASDRVTEVDQGQDNHSLPTYQVAAVLPYPGMSWQVLSTLQEEDVEIGPILRWRKESETRPPSSELEGYGPTVRTLWGQWKSLVIKDGVLCRKITLGGNRVVVQVVLPRSLRTEIMHQLHDSPLGGHRGIRKTFASLQRRVYWPGQRLDTKRWCQTCPVCQQSKSGNVRRRFPLQQRLPGFPLERVAMDVIGPIRPPTKNGNSYILVIEDYFSKYVEAHPLQDHTAQTVADVFVTQWVARYGSCLELHTDQAAEFQSRLFQHILELLGVKKTRTTPYRPQSDGAVERTNRTLKDMLTAYVQEDYENWDEYLPYVMLAYRSAVHDSTGCTPNLLFLNRECNLPVDYWLRPPPEVPASSCPIKYVEWVRNTALSTAEFVRDHLGKALVTQKRNYDVTSHPRTFAPGEKVWREYRPLATSHKFAPSWKGPYQVVERIGDVNYKIKLSPTSSPIVVHVDHLKSFVEGHSQEAETVSMTPTDEDLVPGIVPNPEPELESDHRSPPVPAPRQSRLVPPVPAPRRTRSGRLVKTPLRLDL